MSPGSGLRSWASSLGSGFTTKCERVSETSELIERGVAERLAAGRRLREGFFGGPGTIGDLIAGEALHVAQDVPDAERRARLAAIVVTAAFCEDLDESEVCAELRSLRPVAGSPKHA